MKKPHLLNSVLLLVFLIASHGIRVQAQEVDEDRSKTRMLILGSAIGTYYNLHNQAFPQTWSQLYDEGLVADLSTFIAPGSGTRILSPDQIDTHSDYQLVAKKPVQEPLLMVQEKYGFHDGKAFQLYSDQTFKKTNAPPPVAVSSGTSFAREAQAYREAHPDLVQAGEPLIKLTLELPSQYREVLLHPITLWVGLALYLYIAVCFFVIARKTQTNGAWQAFIPILNAFLLLRIAKFSSWWILTWFIPLVNLIAFLVVFVAVARAVNRGVFSALLALVPGLNLLVFFYWALGSGSSRPVSQSPPRGTAAPTRFCITCGESIPMHARFCPGCGKAVGGTAQATAPPPSTAPESAPAPTAGQLAWAGAFWRVVFLALIAAGSVWAYRYYADRSDVDQETTQTTPPQVTSQVDRTPPTPPVPADAPSLAPGNERPSSATSEYDDFATLPVGVIVQEPDPEDARARGYGFADDFTDKVRPLLIQAIREGRPEFTYTNASGTDSITIDIKGMTEAEVEPFLKELAVLK